MSSSKESPESARKPAMEIKGAATPIPSGLEATVLVSRTARKEIDAELADTTPTTPPQRPSWVGAAFDHFDVGEPLGEGGMGTVYLGRDRSLDRRVAIKVLIADVAAEPELKKRFIREARAQARLQSARVVHIYHIGHTPAVEQRSAGLYFAMEFVDGGSLEGVASSEGERLEPERGRLLLLQVAQGLRDAEQADVVHRDIKPSNLLLDNKGDIKIADFGVAKPVGTNRDSRITVEGLVVGSPLYMAPEQAKGLEVDHRADMYSLGCTFYHLLGGAPPFDGPTPLSVISKHMTEQPPTLAAKAPGLPPKLVKIIDKLMAKEPADRYPCCQELIDDIEQAAPEATQHGGFWARVAAVMVDLVITGLAIGALGWLGLVVGLGYLTCAHAYGGQTLGKYLMNLQVQRVNGAPLSLGRSAARTIASIWMPMFVSLVILLTKGFDELTATIEQMKPHQLDAFKSLVLAVAIGNAILSLVYIAGLALAAFHPQKRAAHDLLSGSQVIYKLRNKKGEGR